MVKLILLFFLVPMIELYLLIKVGSIIGPLNTIIIVILTAIGGGYLARREGLKTLFKIRENISNGVMPTEELTDALFIFMAGVLLLTPGFLTDIMGILMLIPDSRRWMKKRLRKWMEKRVESHHVYIDIS